MALRPIFAKLFYLTLLLPAQTLFAQQDTVVPVYDVVQTLATTNLSKYTLCYTDSPNNTRIEDISKIPFTKTLSQVFPNWRRIQNNLVLKNIYYKFTLKNSGDSLATFYFSPGWIFETFEIYRLTSSGPVPNQLYKPVMTEEQVINHGYQVIQLKAGDSCTFLVKLKFVKTTVNYVKPKIVRTEFAVQNTLSDISGFNAIGILTFIVSGLFLMMIMYSLANFRQAYRIEYLYYGSYTFCVMILLLLKALLIQNSTPFNQLFEGYLDFLIQLSSIILYLLFIRSYLNTKINYPFLEKILYFSQWVVVGVTLLYTYIYFGTDNFILQNNLELYAKFYLVLLGIIFITSGLRYKDKLLQYLVYGNINLIFFGLISLFFIATPFRFKSLPPIFNNSLMYYDLSVLGECILFLIGLSYKNRKDLIERVKMQEAIKMEKERQEMERQLTIINTQQEERNRISADMHDELGAGMTAIRLMSEMAKVKTKNQPLPEIEKISDSANDLLNKMNAIIWSMNSSNDTLPNLVSYIRSYALNYFENFDLKCVIHIKGEVPEKELSGEKRRNIFLTVKEALNNVIKHSGANRVEIDFSFEKNICINIFDNGKGIDKEKTTEFGNGLRNMQKRMERVGGSFTIENKNGTHISLCVPY